MKKLGVGIQSILSNINGEEKEQNSLRRAAEVNHIWKTAVEEVYGDASNLILEHTNAVYIMSAEAVDDAKIADRVAHGGTVLVVYCDDSMIRSDIDARQEFLKIKINKQGERVEIFSIKVSKFGMKSRHPFLNLLESNNIKNKKKNLTGKECEEINKNVSIIDNNEVRSALYKAIVTDLEYRD